MAMGKTVVSTRAGVNGLDLAAGEDFVLTAGAEAMAAPIRALAGGRCGARRDRAGGAGSHGARLQLGRDRGRAGQTLRNDRFVKNGPVF